MSRSGYSDDCDGWSLIMYRGQVASAIRGQRGQRLLLDLVRALDAMPEKRLIADKLEMDGEVCALGAVGQARSIPMADLNPDDSEAVARTFDIADQLAREIVWVNDEADIGKWDPVQRIRIPETPEDRWRRVRAWAVSHLQPVDVVDVPASQEPSE